MEENETIARNLRMLRANLKKTRSEVASDIGVGISTVSAWENTGYMSINSALKLSYYYGVSLDYLVGH